MRLEEVVPRAQGLKVVPIGTAADAPGLHVVDLAGTGATAAPREPTRPVAADDESPKSAGGHVTGSTAVEQVTCQGIQDEPTQGQPDPRVREEIPKVLRGDGRGTSDESWLVGQADQRR
jgi:hypothetical protein